VGKHNTYRGSNSQGLCRKVDLPLCQTLNVITIIHFNLIACYNKNSYLHNTQMWPQLWLLESSNCLVSIGSSATLTFNFGINRLWFNFSSIEQRRVGKRSLEDMGWVVPALGKRLVPVSFFFGVSHDSRQNIQATSRDRSSFVFQSPSICIKWRPTTLGRNLSRLTNII
jgi:hypothetical protein